MNKTAEGGGNRIQNIGKHNLIQQKGGFLHRNKEEIVNFGGERRLIWKYGSRKLWVLVDPELHRLCVVKSRQNYERV